MLPVPLLLAYNIGSYQNQTMTSFVDHPIQFQMQDAFCMNDDQGNRL
jgi:hypothetical protein